jgi:uroporphyrinogen III methyltransferase/synthase
MIPPDAASRAREIFAAARKPDWVTFTSSSTVKNFLSLVQKDQLTGVRIASIGPVTSETIRMHGLEVAAEAHPYTIDGLIAALLLEA